MKPGASSACLVARGKVGSLLQPGRTPTPLEAHDWFAMVLVALMAFAFRWDLRHAQPYIAETWHWHVAVNLWHSAVPNVLDAAGRPFLDLSWFFWQRPLLTLPFHPFADHSFAAYRAAHIAITTMVPPLGMWLLRSLGTRLPAALAVGLLLAVHPLFLPWGVLMLPDMTVLALLLAALLAAHHGRPVPTAVLLWVASWVKEIAFVTALALLVLACWRDGDGRPARAWPPRLGPFARWLLPVVPLAFLPLWVSLQMPGVRFPGFRPGGDLADMLEWLFLAIWLAPVPLLGLASARTRRLVLVAMAWPAFFLVHHVVNGKAMEPWYYVLPAAFTLLAAAATLDALAVVGRPAVRKGVAVAVTALACVVWVQVEVPDGDARNQALVTPLTGRGHWDLEQVQAFEHVRDTGLAELIALPGAGERGTWIVADIEVSFLYYPLAQQADTVYAVWSSLDPVEPAALAAWRDAVENGTDATLLVARDDMPGNVATRLAYAECSTTRWPFVLIRARDCQGAGEDLWERYEEARAASTPAS